MSIHTGETNSAHEHGRLIHWATTYDRAFKVMTLGMEGRFRRRIVEAAGLAAGQRVLDVGCGTGTLALAAARAVGPSGRVEGIDPSPEMIARARSKTPADGHNIGFQEAGIESLPFPDRSFDAVLSSLMFHHLNETLRPAGLSEIRRVLAPGGSLTIIDFAGPGPLFHRLAAQLGHSAAHGESTPHSHAENQFEQLAEQATELGFCNVTVTTFKPRFFSRLRAEVRLDD